MSFASSNDVTFELYKKSVREGESVTLGSNGQSAYCVNYTVLASEEKESVRGDVNLDGKVSVSDAVLLQQYLLCSAELTEQQGEQADIIKDNCLDVFDLIAMKRLLSELN